MAGQYNSYDLDLLTAGEWWEAIKNKEDHEDVPDPIEPHLFPDAVTKMDCLLRTYWCYEAEGWLYSQEKAHDEFVRISNTGDVIKFVGYWATFATRAKANAEAVKTPSSLLSPGKAVELARTGRCYKAVLANMHTVKRYLAAYFSRTLNVKYSLAVLAIEGIKARFDSEGNPNDPFETIQTLLKPDLTLLTDLNKGLQLALMSMAFAVGTTDTTVGEDPWVSFMASIEAKEVPRYVLLNQEVREVEVSKKRETNTPWLILVIMALALYGLYYYNKNS